MTIENNLKGRIIKIGSKYKLCYYEPGDFGWCHVEQDMLRNTKSKPFWGYCSFHCYLPKKYLTDRQMSAVIR